MLDISLDQFLVNVRIADALDILLASIVIYYSIQWLRRRATHAVAVGVVLVAIVYLVARLLDMYLTLAVFQAGLTVILVSLVIIFQQDIRQAFERVSAWRPFSDRTDSGPWERCISTLTEAASLLADEKTGDLIVLQGRQPLDRHTRGGIPAHADLTIPLLHGIFNPRSQGHDGAVLVDHGRVQAFGVHLPLSKNLQEVGPGGTRHSAALGLAERTDALVIVVSEERGTISIAEGTHLETLGGATQMQQRLEAFYNRQLTGPRRHRSARERFSGLGLKFGALLLAAALWFAFAFEIEIVQRTIADVPIEFRNLPENRRIDEVEPAAVTLTLTGPKRALDSLDEEGLKVSMDAEKLREADVALPISAKHLALPDAVSLRSVDPPTVRVRLHHYVEQRLPVRVRTKGKLPEMVELVKLQAEPEAITVQVHRTGRAAEAVATEFIDLSQISETTTRTVGLVFPEGVLASRNDTTVAVTITVKAVNKGQPHEPEASATDIPP